MSYIYSFERLDVWQKSGKLVEKVYHYTRQFPVEEKYGLANQLRRASVSVSSNPEHNSGLKVVQDGAKKTKQGFMNWHTVV